MSAIRKKHAILIPCLSFVTVFSILLILMKVKGYAPFGELSLAWADGDLQYMDFFAWYKNVMAGKDSFLWSYYKGLGGNGIGQFGVYLTSPVNLLLFFFDYTQLPSYFDLAVCLKLALAGAFFAFYLEKRYVKEMNAEICTDAAGKRTFWFRQASVYALSLCYALCQYSIAQSSNIIWLDGLYMFPLLMLGVYEVVNDRPGKWKLALFAGLAVIFNWYSAAMSCIFSVFWFVAEYFLRENREQKGIKVFLRRVLDYVIYMALGMGISCIIFLPMYLSMTAGSRGGLQTELLATFWFMNPFPSIIDLYKAGAQSERYRVSLYCGFLPFLGMLCVFATPKRKLRQKIVYLCLLVFMCLMFYSYPLIAVFSLVRRVGSYWYRYSYLGCFILIFLAAEFLLTLELRLRKALEGTIQNPVLKKMPLILTVVMVVGVVADMTNNAAKLMSIYCLPNGIAYGEYFAAGKEQARLIHEADDSIYRIGQTSGRDGSLNEGLAMGYMSDASNTSTPDARQIQLLNALGYRNVESTLNLTFSALPATDALLGVKYTLSGWQPAGYEDTDLPVANGKNVYKNPYTLPYAFTYTRGEKAQTDGWGYIYINQLYRELAGGNAAVMEYIPYDYSYGDNTVTFTMTLPEGNYIYYGNVPFYYDVTDTSVNANGSYISYGGYFDPSVFEIPKAEGTNQATVTLTSASLGVLAQGYEEFYALNLDRLKAVTEQLQAREVSSVTLENRHVTVDVDNTDGAERLYLSLPYDSGWRVYRNGEEIDVYLVGDCMYSLPLVAGENHFELKYSMPSLWIGFGISLIALGILIVLAKRERRSRVTAEKTEETVG